MQQLHEKSHQHPGWTILILGKRNRPGKMDQQHQNKHSTTHAKNLHRDGLHP